MQDTLILGAGLAGLATAHFLKRDYRLFERETAPGGLVRTEERQGFLFDRTGHWLHLRDAEMRKLVTGLPGIEWCEVRRDSRIHSHGVYTAYPFQSNTYGLPPEVVKEVIGGFIAARYEHSSRGRVRSFEDWVLRHMGAGIAKHFMIPYNHKLWITHPRDMTPHWCQHYVPKPTLDEIIDGAIRPPAENIGYNASFIYPRTGGIGALSTALAKGLPAANIEYGQMPQGINARQRTLRLQDGRELPWRHLVSSLPLPDLIAIIEDAPPTVKQAASRLVCNQVAYYNIALDAPAGNPAHWVYYPESSVRFYRAGCYSNAVPSMAPKGGASLYVEISHRGELRHSAELWREVKQALLKSGYVKRAGDILFHEFRNIPCAYVVFDHEYAAALKTIHPWLLRRNIHSIGRYGRWTYNSMESALLDGRATAALIRSQTSYEDKT